ncbi:hypothetical protein Tco_1468977 [Tanacetum coccineum]
MAFKGEGAGMLMIQNEEVVTSIAVKIAATLHMALSIMKFGEDLPHLSKQDSIMENVEKRPSMSRVAPLKNRRKYWRAEWHHSPRFGHATGEDPNSAHNRYPEIWALIR